MSDIVVHTVDGVTREYRCEKRKANVGELVQVVKDSVTKDYFLTGDIGKVVGYHPEYSKYKSAKVNFNEHIGGPESMGETYGVCYVLHDNYVVLSPTDVVVHNGKRYRSVRRAARNGDRFIVVNLDGDHSISPGIKVGDVYTATLVHRSSDKFNGDIMCVKEHDFESVIRRNEYCVLESIVDELPTNNATLKRTLSDEEIKLVIETVFAHPYEIKQLAENFIKLKESLRNCVSVAKAADTVLNRDEVVERAKLDESRLITTHHPTLQQYYTFRYANMYQIECDAEFVINREKRTVVCLLRSRHDKSKRLVSRGFAKCAPDDVFNVWIGRAISLRRALGLDVPDEYVNAPKPTDVRVGDVVSWGYRGVREIYEIIGKRGDRYDFMKLNNGSVVRDVDYYPHSLLERLIDDSGRYNYTAEE